MNTTTDLTPHQRARLEAILQAKEALGGYRSAPGLEDVHALAVFILDGGALVERPQVERPQVDAHD